MAKLYIKKSDGTYVPQKLQSVTTNIDIVQETGDSQDKVMSQKAVTDALTASDEKLSELDNEIGNPYVLVANVTGGEMFDIISNPLVGSSNM